MAASIFIEQESGIFTRPIHHHNGYYAGDFSNPSAARRAAADSPSLPLTLVHPGFVVHEMRQHTSGLVTSSPRSDSSCC